MDMPWPQALVLGIPFSAFSFPPLWTSGEQAAGRRLPSVLGGEWSAGL